MSKKKSNLSSVNPENIRVIKQEQFEKLQTHFRNTKADRNFLSILGSMLIWIFAIPILLVSFYILSVSILSYFELFGVLDEPLAWSDGVLVEYLMVPLQYSFQTLFNLFFNSDSLFASLEGLYDTKDFIWILTIIFSVISLVMTLFYGSIFIEMFSVTTGKAKNRKKTIWSNILFTAPSLIFVTFLLFGMASNGTFLFSNYDSLALMTGDDFKKWMEYSAILAAAVIVIPSFILLIGKYKTSIYLQIHN